MIHATCRGKSGAQEEQGEGAIWVWEGRGKKKIARWGTRWLMMPKKTKLCSHISIMHFQKKWQFVPLSAPLPTLHTAYWGLHLFSSVSIITIFIEESEGRSYVFLFLVCNTCWKRDIEITHCEYTQEFYDRFHFILLPINQLQYNIFCWLFSNYSECFPSPGVYNTIKKVNQ